MSRILVVGDLILDIDSRYRTVRQSGEGVPVVVEESEDMRLGGAGAVAAMARALGAEVWLCAVTGWRSAVEDSVCIDLLHAAGVQALTLPSDRPQTVKHRVFVDGVQLYRFDEECTRHIPDCEVEDLTESLPDVDVVLISDYDKGVVTPLLLGRLLDRYPGVPTIVDPARDANWSKYRQVACLTPNRAEMGDRDPHVVTSALGLDALVMKRDCDGIALHLRGETATATTPAIIRRADVVDVCGAGDMVLAASGVAIAEGKGWKESVLFANRCAGAKCLKRGAAPLTREEIDALVPENRLESVGA